jgi:hypothetical protein
MILPEDVLWGDPPPPVEIVLSLSPRRAGLVRAGKKVAKRVAVAGVACVTMTAILVAVLSALPSSSDQFVLPNVKAMFLENVVPLSAGHE